MTNDEIRANRYEPIVFLNSPIDSPETDAIGITSAVESIETAIKNGANMIGVLADYGAGKSSLTDSLANSQKEFNPIRINMWDSLSSDDECQLHDDIPALTKSFLYQLAANSSKKRGSSFFSKHINKRLNRNYGLISFSTRTQWQWIIFVLAALFMLYI